MKEVEVYVDGAKPIHLAYCAEKLGKKTQSYQPHCGADAGGLILAAMELKNLNLQCDDCNKQVSLLKKVWL